MNISYVIKKYFKPFSIRLIILFVFSSISAVLSSIFPYITGTVVNEIASQNRLYVIFRLCIILATIFFVEQIIEYLSLRLQTVVQLNAGANFYNDMLFCVQDSPLLISEKLNKTETNQIINQDTTTVIRYTLSTFCTSVKRILSTIILVCICVSINLRSSLLLVLFVLGTIAIYLLLQRKLYDVKLAVKNSNSHYFAKMFEQFAYIPFIKAYSIEKLFRKRICVPFIKLKTAIEQNCNYTFLYTFLFSILSVSIQILMFITGSLSLKSGTFGIGYFVTFSNYFAMLQSSIKYFASLGTGYQSVHIALKRLDKYADMPTDLRGCQDVGNIKGIKLIHLHFEFDNRIVIRDLTYSFVPGKIYGISGKNGCGKSTLINILMGLYNSNLERGMVFYNDIEIHSIDTAVLRKDQITYLGQLPILMDADYQSNVWSIADKHDTQKQRLHTQLQRILNLNFSERKGLNVSTTMSGGEAQKVCLIRSLLKDTGFLLLDEPTNALDAGSVANLMQYLQSIRKNRIIILVSHEAAVLEKCDEVIHMSA